MNIDPDFTCEDHGEHDNWTYSRTKGKQHCRKEITLEPYSYTYCWKRPIDE